MDGIPRFLRYYRGLRRLIEIERTVYGIGFAREGLGWYKEKGFAALCISRAGNHKALTTVYLQQ